MNFSFSTDNGGYFVELQAKFIGNDLLVVCSGGDKPHIGAVAVAHPRPSLDDPDQLSASANIICLSGHREDELARASSLKLCKQLGCTVTVVAGMHWNDIDRAGIEQVIANVESLVGQLMAAL